MSRVYEAMKATQCPGGVYVGKAVTIADAIAEIEKLRELLV